MRPSKHQIAEKKPQNQIKQKSTLLLINTPLQAFLAKKTLYREKIEHYDLLYFTHDNSLEDQCYFNLLKKNAEHVHYFFSPPKRFDFSNHFSFYKLSKYWRQDLDYDLVILASITAPVINAIATFQRNAELVTFDDGVANILPTDFYHTDIIPWRAKLYRKLLGSSSLNRIKKRIVRHYTIFPQFKNIVEQDKIKNLIIFENKKGRQINAKPRVYFIGQPFKEVLKTAQQIKLERYIHTLTIDFYVKHPRERETLKINAPFLDKKGLIAEEAILQDSGESPIHLIGWFSSVMFSLNTAAQSKTIILFQESLELPYMSNLAQQAGCNVIVL